MPSSSTSRPPSPSPAIRPWRHTDSPFMWSNAVVGSLILHLLILVPIARIWVSDHAASRNEDLIAVEVISPPDNQDLASPPNDPTPQQPPPIIANRPVSTPSTSPKPTATPATPTPPNPSSPTPEPTPTPSSPVSTPTPTPSSPTPEPTAEPTPEPTPEPTAEPTSEPTGGESNSPPENENPPPATDEIPAENGGGNPEVPPDSSPPSEDSGNSGAEDGNSPGTSGGSVAYKGSGLPAEGCGGTCPDTPAQPQITPGQEFPITYVATTNNCSGKSLIVTAIVDQNGKLEDIVQVDGQNLNLSDPCAEIASSVLKSWSFQAAESGGSPVVSFLDIHLDFL